MRTGIGYDVHRLVKDRKLILGGIEINYPLGLLGHSDADVLLHAIGDALLGAACLGDIGEFFPDNDPQFKDISSVVLIQEIQKKIQKKGFKIEFIDSILVAQKPKLAPYKTKIKANICKILKLRPDQFNLKATTEEGLGFTGEGQAMKAWASANLVGC